MSRITMNDIAVMSVQYVQYSFPYGRIKTTTENL